MKIRIIIKLNNYRAKYKTWRVTRSRRRKTLGLAGDLISTDKKQRSRESLGSLTENPSRPRNFSAGEGEGGRAAIYPSARQHRHSTTRSACRERASTRHFVIFRFGAIYLEFSFEKVGVSISVWKRQSRRSASRVVLVNRLSGLEFGAFRVLSHHPSCNPRSSVPPFSSPTHPVKMMAVAAAQKNREMFAIKKSYSIEVSWRTC